MSRRPLLGLVLILAAAFFYYRPDPAINFPWDGRSETAGQKEFSGRVSRVADGDSIEMKQSGRTIRIRLYGIDAPELNQDHGPEARDWLADRLLGKTVRIETQDIDQYERLVALVFIDDAPINQALVSAGQAWVYERYCSIDLCRQMQRDEREARQKKLGLWGKKDKPTPPWRWRRSNPSRQ